ncbi:MAG: two-component system regulatory protein YycI [Clostridia bacterium]|nr:two-component system regulatory protein YycI [Clostridia bacterium]
MDWSKIKTILIVSFIIINLILGYIIYGTQQTFEKKVPVESEVFDQVVALLASKNISVDFDLESYMATVPSLTVSYESYDLNQSADNFLGEGYEVIDGVAILGEEAVKVENDTTLKYFFTTALDDKNDCTLEGAQGIAERFLAQYGYETEDAPWRIDQQGEFLVVTYKQFYKSYYLDEAYMTLAIYDDHVVRFSRKWFQSVAVQNVSRQIVPPSEALFKVIERAYNETVTYGAPIVIEKMELGYRLDDSILFSYIKSGDVFPYWRITFSDGRIIYIEAVKR